MVPFFIAKRGMTHNYGQHELITARTAVREAVDLIGGNQAATSDAERPQDKIGVLTIGDLQAEKHIVAALRKEFPDDEILSEESGLLATPQASSGRLWVLDPMDGSRGFKDGNDECAICVGLLDPDPLLAVVMNPRNRQQYTAVGGRGMLLNGKTAVPSAISDPATARIAVSRSEHKRGWWADFPLATIPMGSIAWKIVLVAAGKLDATITYTPKNLWDVAAALIIAAEAGCIICDGKGRPVHLSPKDRLLETGFIVSAPGIARRLTELAIPWIATRPDDCKDARG